MISLINTSIIRSSFIQSWLVEYWDSSRWDQEFESMYNLGFDSLIIQSIFDETYSNGHGSKWFDETLTNSRILFPSPHYQISGVTYIRDHLKLAFESAKKFNMKIHIGLAYDSRFWKWGWTIPEVPNGESDLFVSSYLRQWIDHNVNQSQTIINEIWDIYGSNYSEQIASWYMVNEIWNIDQGCKQTDNQIHAKLFGHMISGYVNASVNYGGGKPIMLSPFVNFGLSNASENSVFWTQLLSFSNMRSIDILAPQDSLGNNENFISTFGEWMSGWKTAADSKGVQLWVNNECFGPNYVSASIERFGQQYSITHMYTNNHIMFSWNHYYNPLYNSSFTDLNNQFKDFLVTQYNNQQNCPSATSPPGNPIVLIAALLVFIGVGALLYFRIIKKEPDTSGLSV